jgi:hypothetical protein
MRAMSFSTFEGLGVSAFAGAGSGSRDAVAAKAEIGRV